MIIDLERIAIARREEQLDGESWRVRDPGEAQERRTCPVCQVRPPRGKRNAVLCEVCHQAGWTAGECENGCGRHITRVDQMAKPPTRRWCKACRTARNATC